jgi:hypothetical protein
MLSFCVVQILINSQQISGGGNRKNEKTIGFTHLSGGDNWF